jgi:hypothetical protein
VSGYGTGRPGDRVSIPGGGKEIYPLTSVSRPVLGPTQPPVQWVLRVLSQGVKRGRGVTLTAHPYLLPRWWTSRNYTISPLLRLHRCAVGQLHLFITALEHWIALYKPNVIKLLNQEGRHGWDMHNAIGLLNTVNFVIYYIWSSGFWHRVVLKVVTKVSEELTVPIFRDELLLTIFKSIRCHNLEN